jgi:hypothetical protein
VTGGGLTPEGEWVDVANPRCLVAVKPLMWEFRKRFCQALKELLKKALLEQEPAQAGDKPKQAGDKPKQAGDKPKQAGDKPKKQETLTLPQGTTPRQWLNRVNKVNRQDWDVFISKPPEDGGPTTRDLEKYQSDAVAGGPLVAVRLEPNSAPYFVPEAIMSPDPLPAPQPDLDVSSAQIVYLKSAPMSASRLKDTQEDTQKDPQKQERQVTFRWGVYDPNTGKRERDRTEPLPVDEFLRRLVQHVPPSRYQTVRHYGLYAAAKNEAYEHCREGLSDREPEPLPPDSEDEATDAWIEQHSCPVCSKPLIVSSYIPSSVTGRYIPRVPIGHVYAPHSSLGGGHDP